MAQIITEGLSDVPAGNEPTHGDFHEARSTCGMATCAESSMSTPSGQDAGR
ncbi:hypothetical protein JCM18916_2759 [Cutibacterium acnes JCM 18916]|nr:hypothetical protein JCM18916_2759 [Cutibacterium acnes JCM 18916]